MAARSIHLNALSMSTGHKLGDSWEDDVRVGDEQSGVWGDNDKIHPALHRPALAGVRA